MDAEHDGLEQIALKGTLDNLRKDLFLHTSTSEGTIISWSSSAPEYLSSAGRVIKLSEKGKKEVTLTATAQKGSETATREFTITLAENEDFSNYLFTFFPSNSNENLYYALSTDGFNYTVLNNGNRIMLSDTISLKKGIRDPHIMRAPDGKTFYMVMTDMKSAEGWSSNRGLVMMKSQDLVNWEHSTVHFPTRFAKQWSNRSEERRVGKEC